METSDNIVKINITGKRVKLRCVKCSLSSYWYANLVGQVLEFYENDPSEEMSYSLAADIDRNRATVGGADLGDFEIATDEAPEDKISNLVKVTRRLLDNLYEFGAPTDSIFVEQVEDALQKLEPEDRLAAEQAPAGELKG